MPDPGRALRDVAVVLLAFLAGAVLVGLLWPQLVDPVVVTRAEDGLLTGEVALGDRFDTVGWYSLLSGGCALVLAVLLSLWRRGHEVVTLLAVLAGSCVAAWLSAQVGTWVGPDDPAQVLRDAEVGATAPDRVALAADVAYLVWPIAALVGSVVVLFSRPEPGLPIRSSADAEDRT